MDGAPRTRIEVDDTFVDDLRTAGFEGVMMKRATSVYRPGERTKSWIKIKARRLARVVIGGHLLEPSRTSIGALAVGMYDPAGRFRYVGQCGNALPTTDADGLSRFLANTRTEHSPFADLTSDQLAYVEPFVVAEIDFTEITDAATSCQPILRRICIGEPPAIAVMPTDLTVAIEGRTNVRVGSRQRL